MFRLKVRTARPPRFEFKNRLSNVREVETSFRRMNVRGNGKLSKEEMLSGDEFSREEVSPSSGKYCLVLSHILQYRSKPCLSWETSTKTDNWTYQNLLVK